MKATNGQPLQRIQRGIARPSPCRLANSVSAPSGQNTPHHARPTTNMLRMTKGHQMPQNANCANSLRSDRRVAPDGGGGRNAGTTTSSA